MTTKNEGAELWPALIKARKAMGPLVKSATNPHFRSKYADLGAIMDTIADPLLEHGLIIVQHAATIAEEARNVVEVRTRIIHESGEETHTEGSFTMAGGRDDIQAVGSIITYLRRYQLQALLGLAAQDDDGEGAMSRQQEPAPAEKPAPDPFADKKTIAHLQEIAAEFGLAEPDITMVLKVVTKNECKDYACLRQKLAGRTELAFARRGAQKASQIVQGEGLDPKEVCVGSSDVEGDPAEIAAIVDDGFRGLKTIAEVRPYYEALAAAAAENIGPAGPPEQHEMEDIT